MKAGRRSCRAARTAGQAAGFLPPPRWADDLAEPRRSRPNPGPDVWQPGDVSMQIPSPEPRLTAEEYLGAAPDAYGHIEVVDGLVVHDMAQSEVHDLVVRRLAAALENARPADGPCFRVSSGMAVRFADSASSRANHRLNVRYPDIMVRDCDPCDVNTVRDRIQLLVEVTSEATFEADTTAKRVLYAAAGIPGYLVVHFDKDWTGISEIEEYRLDWSSRRYVVQDMHRRALILDEPFRLTATFDDLQRP
jgi:Uma2 family endonuclease